MKNSKIMELKPNYQQFFELAKGLVRDNIPQDKGRDTVIEMLDYGKRLDKSREEVTNEQ